MRKQLQACFVARSLSRKDSISIVSYITFIWTWKNGRLVSSKYTFDSHVPLFLAHSLPTIFPTIFPTFQLQGFVGFLRVFTSLHGLEL